MARAPGPSQTTQSSVGGHWAGQLTPSLLTHVWRWGLQHLECVLSWDHWTDYNLSLISILCQMIAGDGWWLAVVWSPVIPRLDSVFSGWPGPQSWYFLSLSAPQIHERFLSLSWNRLTGKLSKQKYTDTQIFFWSKGCYFCNAHAHPSFLKLLLSGTGVKSLNQHAT